MTVQVRRMALLDSPIGRHYGFLDVSIFQDPADPSVWKATFRQAWIDPNWADDDTLDRLESDDRVAFRYCTPEGETTSDGNPNGSIRNIAGIFNETKTVLGLMPHPENAVEPELGPADGAALFSGLTAALH